MPVASFLENSNGKSCVSFEAIENATENHDLTKNEKEDCEYRETWLMNLWQWFQCKFDLIV